MMLSLYGRASISVAMAYEAGWSRRKHIMSDAEMPVSARAVARPEA